MKSIIINIFLMVLGFLIALSGVLLIKYQAHEEYHIYQGTANPSETTLNTIRDNGDGKGIHETDGSFYIDLKTKNEYPELKPIEQRYTYSIIDSKLGIILILFGMMFIIGGFVPRHPAIDKYYRNNPPDIYY